MRLKIIAGNLVAVLIVGLGSYFYVKSELEKNLGAQVDQDIANESQLLARSWRLSGLEFVEQVRERANTNEVRGAFGALDESSRRTRAHQQANSVASWFQDPARGRGGRPDIVLLTDETGRVIARDQDINRLNGTSLVQPLPSIRRALQGNAARDAWLKEDENKLLQVAMAPVRNQEGGVIGVLLVGYDISNGFAEREAEVLGREVAFLREGSIYSSSLDQGVVSGLQSELFGEMGAVTTAALGGQPSSPFTTRIGGTEFVGVVAPLPATPSQQLAVAVLGNKTAQTELAAVSQVILILMAVGFIFVVVYGFILGTSIIRPIEQIEEGVLRVVNGQTDHRIDVKSTELGGLAYTINQLINVFTGVEETDAEGRSRAPGSNWGGAAAPTTGTSPSPGGGGDAGGDEDAELAAQLAAEPAEQYEARIYQEYVAAKQAAGEDVSNIPQDRFIARLRKNAENLTKKHGCRMVRFQVQTKGNQVILRPVVIR